MKYLKKNLRYGLRKIGCCSNKEEQDHLQIINNRSDYSNRSDCENINDKRYHRWHPGKAFSDEASVKKCICRKHW